MKRIAILGGAFNPVHVGHLMVAQMVWEEFGLDKVIFVPCHLPPHKSGRALAAAEDRLKMVRLAVCGNSRFTVSDVEIKRGGKSYSADTVAYFRGQYPKGTKFFFIIGGDNLLTLHTWKRVEDIVKMCSFVAVCRPGFKVAKSGIKAKSIIIPVVHISSSDIRKRVGGGRTVKYLVPDNVMAYIKKRKLYQ